MESNVNIKVFITIEGGLVQFVHSTHDIDVTVIDRDIPVDSDDGYELDQYEADQEEFESYSDHLKHVW